MNFIFKVSVKNFNVFEKLVHHYLWTQKRHFWHFVYKSTTGLKQMYHIQIVVVLGLQFQDQTDTILVFCNYTEHKNVIFGMHIHVDKDINNTVKCMWNSPWS